MEKKRDEDKTIVVLDPGIDAEDMAGTRSTCCNGAVGSVR